MEKEYMLKTGGFYLCYICVSEDYPEQDFLQSIQFTVNKERALTFGSKEKVLYLQKILYVNLGIDLVIEEN